MISRVGETGYSILPTGGPGSSQAVSFTPTATGNMLVVHIGALSGGRNFTISDNIDGIAGWKSAILKDTGSDHVEVFYKENIPSGITTITISQDGSSIQWVATIAEFSGMGSLVSIDDSDTLVEGGSTNNHTSSASGVSSASPEVLGLVSGILTIAGVECLAGSGWTETPVVPANSSKLFEFQIFTGPVINELGAWSNTGTARIGVSCIALLSPTSTQSELPFRTFIDGKRF